MKRSDRWKRMFFLYFIIIPVLAQILALAGMKITESWESKTASLAAIAVLEMGLLYGVSDFAARKCGKGAQKEQAGKKGQEVQATELYAPLVAALFYYLIIFIIPFGLTNYKVTQLGNGFFLGSILWFPMIFMLTLGGELILYPVVQMSVYLLSILLLALNCIRHKTSLRYTRKTAWMFGAAALLCLVSGYQLYDRSQRILGEDYSVARVEDEVDRWDYVPFRVGNKLWTPEVPPALEIKGDYPRIDGATAAYPVYGAMVQAVYKGLDQDTVFTYVSCSGTNQAYERLMKGETDIFFGAQPSAAQVEAAARLGKKFHLTPVGREAFVFFVSRENPVESLTIGQIQDIYQKKTVNWKRVGGMNERIIPFQRPEGSGSQTVMQAVMGEKSLPMPLMEEYAAGMGGVIEAVASYRNYSGAIGYSFRYFATGMKPNDDIRLLAVNGVEPTVDNIKNGSYPFTVEIYAVTTGELGGNGKALIDWILTGEGQEFLEGCGYVGL